MKDQTPTSGHGAPDAFVSKYGDKITGILAGFDRVRFRATLRLLFKPGVLETYLQACDVLIKHFKPFAEKITQRIRRAAWQAAETAGRPVHYLNSSQISKEELARKIARDDVGEDRRPHALPFTSTSGQPLVSWIRDATGGNRLNRRMNPGRSLPYWNICAPQFGHQASHDPRLPNIVARGGGRKPHKELLVSLLEAPAT